MTAVSTTVLSSSLRAIVGQTQERILVAEKEVASGRRADLGLWLGGGVREAVSLRRDLAELNRLRDTNAAATVRLEGTQAALQAELKTAQSFTETLLTARDNPQSRDLVAAMARDHLASLIANANTTSGGAYFFGGVNSGEAPLADYFSDPASAARSSVEAAFLAEFGFSFASAAAYDIPAPAMETFLAGPFAALFDAPGWSADWSRASDEPLRIRISESETAEIGVTANADGFRKLASAYAALTEFGAGAVNDQAFRAVIDAALSAIGEGVADLSGAAAKLGAVEERVSVSSERLERRITLLSARSDDLEGVDPYEASTRLTALQTQLETAYALTARLQGLSLLNYLQP
ncbi:MAG: flagellar hook-associated family protein [Hyphomicrobiales bacterium]|nr:flagellar hook-associated family protein [Hyphomicrobiales bacterium]